MTATWAWHQKTYTADGQEGNAAGVNLADSILIGVGSSLQRVILQGSAWGNLYSFDQQSIPCPVQYVVRTTVYMTGGGQGTQFIWTYLMPVSWDFGWTISETLGGRAYWTCSAKAPIDCDVAVRKKDKGTGQPVALNITFESLVDSFTEPNQNPKFPALHLEAHLRWLTSTA
jgi:hypothetical protein